MRTMGMVPTALLGLLLIGPGCGGDAAMANGRAAERGRLTARPLNAGTSVSEPGLRALRLDEARDGVVYLPDRAGSGPMPLIVMLHGAGGDAAGMVELLRGQADAEGIALLFPDSRAATWDVIRGDYGPDVDFIDKALAKLFAEQPIDPDRIALAGFSDGASYALSLGVMNGDLFSHILAFSPGFIVPLSTVGEPEIYISHGVEDQVLPIRSCSRRIVPRLEEAGYSVLYREFPDGHVVPPDIVREATDFFLGRMTGD